MTRVAWAIGVGVLLTLQAGCHHHPGPYPQNYGGYPVYPSPPPVQYPSAPGSFVMPNQAVPGMVSPGMTPAQPGPTLAPQLNGGGNAPPSTFEGGATPNTDPGGLVPDYRSPGVDDFGTAPSGNGFQQPQEESPFMPGTAVPSTNGYATNAPAPNQTPDYFSELDEFGVSPSTPTQTRSPNSAVQPAGFEMDSGNRPGPLGPATGPAGGSATGGASENEQWYAYDRQGYRWLQGVIDIDAETGQVGIIYGVIPEPSDRYGGYLLLLDHPSLADFQTNDVVRVQGAIDPSAGQDKLGKPYFRIQNAELIGRYE